MNLKCSMPGSVNQQCLQQTPGPKGAACKQSHVNSSMESEASVAACMQ